MGRLADFMPVDFSNMRVVLSLRHFLAHLLPGNCIRGASRLDVTTYFISICFVISTDLDCDVDTESDDQKFAVVEVEGCALSKVTLEGVLLTLRERP